MSILGNIAYYGRKWLGMHRGEGYGRWWGGGAVAGFNQRRICYGVKRNGFWGV